MDEQTPLRWIDTQAKLMQELVEQWANLNTFTYHVAGVRAFAEILKNQLSPFAAESRLIDVDPHEIVDDRGRLTPVPLGPAVWARNRPNAARRALLCIHTDTVYPPDPPLQRAKRIDAHRLRGPGVVDAKGGIVVLLTALGALERSSVAGSLGWEVLLNPDEEVGSPGSTKLLRECAARTHLGLLFEPAMPDGSLVGARKGSGNFTVVVHGRAAHAGRDFQLGRNAIQAMAEAIGAAAALNGVRPGVTVNVGKVSGGGPVNVVPDLAVFRMNIRVTSWDDMEWVSGRLREIVEGLNSREGFSATMHGGFGAPPKPVDSATEKLLRAVAECGRELGLEIRWRDSGGVSDGNRLAAAGLVNVDSLGPRGGGIHSGEEYIELDSLVERAKLTALLLMRLASGELAWPVPEREAVQSEGGPDDRDRA